MSGPNDERETLASETSLASEDTVQADSAPGGGGPNIVRSGRRSAPRTKLGRYTLGQLLGRGGIGEVYEADDPELGRRVAIKILREGRGDTTTLLREAQALAKLEHPNVVAVYDVGSEDGTVFVVMPLIAGESIDKWLRGRRAGPHAIVAAFVQAGRGLAAAHAAGLVHCDFKPGNVLVDKQGAVRVGDFGLARGADEDAAIAGTPAYMAPEQFAGKPTAASDQFSFCVALWEVLAGELPYETPTSIDSGMQRAADRVRKPLPRGARIPARVTRALDRGLATDPAQRFASMPDLLAALSPPRRTGLAVAALIPVLAGGAVAAWSLGRGAPPPPAPPAPPLPPELDLAHARALTQYGTTACAYSPTITADDHVVFDRTEGDAVDLYEVAIAGGPAKQLTSAPNWEWRASRGRTANEVLYLAQDSREQVGGIDALDLESGKTARLLDVWSASTAAFGDTIYYIPGLQREVRAWQGGKDRALVTAQTGAFRLLTVSPAGDRLAVIESTGDGPELVFIHLTTGQIDRPHIPASVGRPAFSSDGRFVYYVANQGIGRRELATFKDELVVHGVNAIGGIAVAPDGGALVYSDCGTRSRAIDVTARDRVVVDDPDVRVVNTGPDGSLVWLRDQRGRTAVIVRDRAGHERQVSDPDQGDAMSPVLSPNGKFVAYTIGQPNPGIRIAVVAPGGDIHRVTEDLGDSSPMWLGDDRIVFMRAHAVDDAAMYVVSVDGGPIKRFGAVGRTLMGVHGSSVLAATTERFVWIDAKTGLERPGPAGSGTVSMVALSPDGKWLALATSDIASDLLRVSIDPPGKLEHVASLAGGETATSVAVTDDGRVIVVAATWSGDLHVIPAAPGSKL